jgi:preprotein translocase subunit YajC
MGVVADKMLLCTGLFYVFLLPPARKVQGHRQILEGLQPGELVATEGALFLSNALASASR